MFIGNLNIIGRDIYGGAAFANDYSVLLDGVDEYVSTGIITDMNGASTYSVSFWFRIKVLGSTETIFSHHESGTDRFDIIKLNTNLIRVDITNGASSYAETTTTFSEARWYHISVTYNGGGATNADKLKVYIDGTSDTLSFTGTIPTTTGTKVTGSTFIGGGLSATTPNYFVNGYIDEVALFDYELTSGQVTSLYNSGTPTDLDNTSGVTAPTHWWRMGDGDTYPTITDVGTTGGNNGTMTNAESTDIVAITPPAYNIYGMDFDGANDYLSLSGTPSCLVSATEFTVNVWRKKVGFDTGAILQFYTSDTDRVELLASMNTNPLVYMYIGNGTDANYRISNGALFNAYWNLISVVYNGGGATNADRLKIYVNGVEDTGGVYTGTIPSSTSSTSSHTYEQISRSGTSAYLRGKLDELSIMSYAMSPSEITELYNTSVPMDIMNAGFAAPDHFWRMGDGSDTISLINDVGSIGGIDATPQNMDIADIELDSA